MKSDLDDMLAQLGAQPTPEALAAIEGAVIAGTGARRERMIARRALALAGCVSLLVGVGGAMMPAGRAAAEPLLGLPDAAPSHLLID